ncbi:acid protease [Hyaloscypha variabilis]
MFPALLILISLLASSRCSDFSRSADALSRGIVRLPITTAAKDPAFSKRQINDAIVDSDVEHKFLISIGVGTPSQNVTVSFDTGSSDLWVFGTCIVIRSTNCSTAAPQYFPEKSTTAKDQRRGDDIEYGADGTNMTGEYYSDNISIEGVQVQAQQFLVANTTVGTLGIGLMGVGLGASFFNNIIFSGNITYADSTNSTNNQTIHYRHPRAPNIIDQMAAQGLINSRAFGLGLRDDTEGSIIFGGIDTKKYSGMLGKFPMISWKDSPDKIPRYWLNMSRLSAWRTDPQYPEYYTSDFEDPVTVFLDSGTHLSYLPLNVIEPVVKLLGATKVDSNYYEIECETWGDYNFTYGRVEFGFGNLTINVPLKDLIHMTSDELCLLGVAETDDPMSIPYVLGESFLKAAFVVFDQDNQNIHLAQGANCGTNLVAIGKGVDAVPSLQGDCVAPILATVATNAMVASTAKSAMTVATKATSSPITIRPKTTSRIVGPARSTRTTVTKKPGATGFVDSDNW